MLNVRHAKMYPLISKSVSLLHELSYWVNSARIRNGFYLWKSTGQSNTIAFSYAKPKLIWLIMDWNILTEKDWKKWFIYRWKVVNLENRVRPGFDFRNEVLRIIKKSLFTSAATKNDFRSLKTCLLEEGSVRWRSLFSLLTIPYEWILIQ